jgi:hypothetical protein
LPGHEGIVGNEKAEQLARTGSEHPFTGPEQTWRMSVGVAKKAVRDWTSSSHQNIWESTILLKQAKELTTGPSARRTKDLVS